MALAGIFVLVVAGWLLAGGVGNSAIASRDGSPSRITLQSGQTLWDVADRYAPAGIDPRAYVDALLRMNNIEGAPQSGQRLRLPR
jgi:Tfp pilus assembly protein FimV